LSALYKHDGDGLFIQWTGIIDGLVREVTMDQMTRRAFSAAGFALLLAPSASFAQQTARVRGTVRRRAGG
jgi:hypothetical protein